MDKREIPSLAHRTQPWRALSSASGITRMRKTQRIRRSLAVRSEAMKRNMELQHSAMEDAKKVREARRTSKALGDCASCGTGKRRTRKTQDRESVKQESAGPGKRRDKESAGPDGTGGKRDDT